MSGKERKDSKDPRGGAYTGVIKVNTRGVGYIAHEDFDEDIEVHEESLNTALHGDEVSFALLSHPSRARPAQRHDGRGRRSPPRERLQGEVTEVLARARRTFVGTVEKDERGCFVVPQDPRMYVDFLIPAAEARKARQNDKVLVELAGWTDPAKNPRGSIIKVIGQKGVHDVEMHAIVLENGFDSDFPHVVLRDAGKLKLVEHLTDSEIAARRDFRPILTCTIDPVDAKDFDDAISFRELPDGLCEVGVHIADVSHYVREDTPLDREAIQRATSVYLVDRTIPMLPDILSNDLCSLTPDDDKLTFSAVFVLDKEARIHERWFGKTVIRSRKRLTYEEAQEAIDASFEPRDPACAAALKKLNELARSLHALRHRAGAIEFEENEVRFELDSLGKPIRVHQKKRTDSHRLIEEFMLLANREVAEHIHTLEKKIGGEKAFLYRVHDIPDEEKIESLAVFVRAIGYEFEMSPHGVTGKDLQALFERVEGHAHEGLIKKAALRAMAKAAYSLGNIGHFGLAFGYYTHFTSPIRRYPDILVHRLLHNHLLGRPVAPQQIAGLHALALHSSRREIEAVEAERASIKYKQVEYMSERIGESFDATISGVTEWGMYVEEKETRAEGMVRLRSLSDDYYELDPKNYTLVGSSSRKKYTLGDSVRVRLVGADLNRRTLDFIFDR